MVGSRTAYGQNADIRGADTVADMDYHGQLADADAVTDWTRTRPVVDWTRPRIGHGLTVAADIGVAIWPDRLRIHLVHCADAKTSF